MLFVLELLCFFTFIASCVATGFYIWADRSIWIKEAVIFSFAALLLLMLALGIHLQRQSHSFIGSKSLHPENQKIGGTL